MTGPSLIIIGGGVAGIAMAHTLKWKLGCTDFTVRERQSSKQTLVFVQCLL